jgi:hypothetical protein
MTGNKNHQQYGTSKNILSERIEYNSTAKKTFNKKDTLDDVHFESHRDISPYRIENFIDMLHNFGISDATIKKKIASTAYGYFGHELSSESHNEMSQIKNVRNCLNIVL